MPAFFGGSRITRNTLILQLDDDPDAESKLLKKLSKEAQETLESVLFESWTQCLEAYDWEDMYSGLSSELPWTALENIVNKIPATYTFQQTLDTVLTKAATTGLFTTKEKLEGGFGFGGINWNLPHAEAIAWAKSYSYELVKQINDTTAKQLQTIIPAWAESGEPLSGLSKRLEPVFGSVRAEMIAQTEVTRAYAHGSFDAYEAAGFGPRPPDEKVPPAHPRCRCTVSVGQINNSMDWDYIWYTAQDDLVCDICRPLHITSMGRAGQIEDYDPRLPSAAPAIDPNDPASRGTPAATPRAVPPSQKPATTPGMDNKLVTFDKTPLTGKTINGIPLEEVPAPAWHTIPDKSLGEPPPPYGGTISTGVIFVEEDGRVWIYEPTNHYGGYENTFSKGRVEPGLTYQQNALKEAYEELGLTGEISGFLGDFKGTTTTTRFYVGKRTGGAPWRAHWEADKVKLATPEELAKLLNMSRDKDVLKQLNAYLANQKSPGATEPVKRGRGRPKKQPGDPKSPYKPRVKKAPKGGPPDGFPGSLDELRVIKGLGGSTGAQLVEDPRTGRRFVRKAGADPSHLLEETYGDHAYRALGYNVPEYHVYSDEKGNPIKLAEYIDGRIMGDLKYSDPKAYAAAQKELRRGMAADALMANWDVTGSSDDNILIDKEGKVWRIDNGGSFRRRARGEYKGAEWSDEPMELWTMRGNGFKHSLTAKHYGDMTYDEVMEQVKAITRNKAGIQAMLDGLPPEIQKTVKARLANFEKLEGIHKTFRDDKWSDYYTDNFSKHVMGINKAGIPQKFPKRLDHTGYTEVVDENGKLFDQLRGRNSRIKDLAGYMSKNGMDLNIVAKYQGGQGGNSWNSDPIAFKYFVAQNRPGGDYYWHKPIDLAKEKYESRVAKYGKEAYENSLMAYHAYTYEQISRIQFKNKDLHKPGTVRVMRTEHRDLVPMYGLKKGEWNVYPRGTADSTSIYKLVFVGGSTEEMQMDVPYHRFYGNYFGERTPEYGDSVYLGDGENEFVALLDGIPAFYAKSHNRGY